MKINKYEIKLNEYNMKMKVHIMRNKKAKKHHFQNFSPRPVEGVCAFDVGAGVFLFCAVPKTGLFDGIIAVSISSLPTIERRKIIKDM